MRFIAKLQEYAQPILNGQTGNLRFETNCHILEPGEPSFSTTRQRLFHQYLCHNIKYCNVCSKLRTSPVYAVKYVAHKVIHTPWLYGPASLRNKTLIYPCEKFQCQIGCPCKMCRGLLTSCQDLEDHVTYHRAPHTLCQFCNELARIIPNYSWQIVYKIVYYPAYPVPQFEKYYEIMVSASLFKHSVAEILPSSKQKPIPCDKCDMKFRSIYHLKRHEVSIHYEPKVQAEMYKCEICLKMFDKKFNYTRHKKTGKSNCSICAELFCTLKQLQQHKIKHHPKQLKCTHCNKTFSLDSNLKRHVAGRIIVKCVKCEKSFCNNFDLQILQNNEHARTCNICYQGPFSSKNYQHHMYSKHQKLIDM